MEIDFPSFSKGIKEAYTTSHLYESIINNTIEIRTFQFIKYKGNLRVSWAFDINYNKNIDLIFFPEENPYIKYAYLYAKDFVKKLEAHDERFYDPFVEANKVIKEMRPSYNINYDFVKEILSQSDLSQSQQERFFQVRFGSVFVPMEIEFEWYAYTPNFTYVTKDELSPITFFYYDRYLNYAPAFNPSICLGIIKSYKVLPTNTALNVIEEKPLEYDRTTDRFITYKDLFTPLPTAALATTQTNINDFIVNLRDKPDTKEGKIIAQLFSQEFSNTLLIPKFQKLQEENDWGDETTFSFLYKELSKYYLAQKSYYEKEKQNLINPLWCEDYLILVWNIESNNWAKVWVLKTPDKKTTNINEKTFEALMKDNDIRDSVREVIATYTQTFLESPSQLKLYEGYIHCSGLQYLLPFTQNYIKR